MKHFLLLFGALLLSCGTIIADTSQERDKVLAMLLDRVEHPIVETPNSDAAKQTAIRYLTDLQKNWDDVIKRKPEEFPESISRLQEMLQFYFAGREDYSEKNTKALLAPPLPLTAFGYDDLADGALCRQGLALRLSWFRLWVHLGNEQLLESDHKLQYLQLFTQFIREIESGNASKWMQSSDLETLFAVYEGIPLFTDDYLSRLASHHEEIGKGDSIDRMIKRGIAKDRLEYYRLLTVPIMVNKGSIFEIIYAANPKLYAERILSVVKEMRMRVAKGIEAVRELPAQPDKSVQAASAILGEATQVNSELTQLQLPLANGNQSGAIAWGDNDRRNLIELSKYLPGDFAALQTVLAPAKGDTINPVHDLKTIMDTVFDYYSKYQSPEIGGQLFFLQRDMQELTKLAFEKAYPKQ